MADRAQTAERNQEPRPHGGLLWKPKPGTTATFEEFAAARERIVEIHHDAEWNPWVREDCADELEVAMVIFGQWTRAEPGFRQLTSKQFGARMATWDRKAKRDRARIEARQARDQTRYDPEREANRLALLERESRLAYELSELAMWQDGTKFYGIVGERRQREIAEAEQTVEKLRADVDRLRGLVGDPETVVNVEGELPADRRQDMLNWYRLERERQVKQLRPVIAEHETTLKSLKGRAERAEVRSKLQAAQRKLDALLAVPPLTADDMCSECPTPASHHGWSTPPHVGPCPAWPGWAARMKEFRRMFDEMVERHRRETAPPPPPKPEPLAVVESGLSVTEVIARLQALQAQYPQAEVRRGRANRWELWPAPETER